MLDVINNHLVPDAIIKTKRCVCYCAKQYSGGKYNDSSSEWNERDFNKNFSNEPTISAC